MMMHRIKCSKSLVESGGGGLSVLLLPLQKSSQKGLVPSLERLVISDVGRFSSAAPVAAILGLVPSPERLVISNVGRFSSAAAAPASAIGESESSSLLKMDMLRVLDIPNLFRGRRQTRVGGCVGSFVPHQCNKSHMLPCFARTLASSSASQSSGQTQRQESEKKKTKECQIIRSSEFQRERCDEISSTEVSLNQFPGLMVCGNKLDSETRRLLRLKPETGYFEEEQDVSAAASDHHGHYELQVPHESTCRGSAYGWLFVTYNYFYMKLLNPFSGAEIQLPPVATLPMLSEKYGEGTPTKWSVNKAVFSANPSIEPRPVVFVIYKVHVRKLALAFCKPGDEKWTLVEFKFSEQWLLVDAIYHKGQFYVLGWGGDVAAFDIGRCIDDDDHSVKTTLIATARESCGSLYKRDPLFERMLRRDNFLVMLDGDLVKFELRSVSFHDCCIHKTKEVLVRDLNRDGDTSDEEDYFDEDCSVDFDDEDYFNGKKVTVVDPRLYCADPRPPFCTYSIKIRRFDESEKQWVKMESLGDKAVFLGYNESFALSAYDYPAGVCIPDSVYFTDRLGLGSHMIEIPFYDIGIYNLKDKRVKPLYPPMYDVFEFCKPAPIWIVNSGR